jgi:hypothetical protein
LVLRCNINPSGELIAGYEYTCIRKGLGSPTGQRGVSRAEDQIVFTYP